MRMVACIRGRINHKFRQLHWLKQVSVYNMFVNKKEERWSKNRRRINTFCIELDFYNYFRKDLESFPGHLWIWICLCKHCDGTHPGPSLDESRVYLTVLHPSTRTAAATFSSLSGPGGGLTTDAWKTSKRKDPRGIPNRCPDTPTRTVHRPTSQKAVTYRHNWKTPQRR